MRRLALGLVLLTAGAVVPFAAQADTVKTNKGTHRFVTTDALVQVIDGPTNSHRTTIDTRLYVPDNATRRTPQPAVLMTHGFGLTKASPEVTSMATFLARHGFVVLTYTAQGFGHSSGCVSLQSRTYDVKDASQLITKVLATNPAVKKDRKGPIVGTVGGSYGGGIQANLAEADPRVRAINPYRTWNTLQYSLDPNNWVVPGDKTGFTHTLAPQGVFKKNWTTLFWGSGMGQPLGGLPPTGEQNGSCPQEKLTPTEASGSLCTGFRMPVCDAVAKLSATGDADDAAKTLVADASATTQISRLRVPTLLVQGQSDTIFNLNDATATYTQLRRQHVPVQMIWNSGGHGGYTSRPGECEVFDGSFGGVAPTVLDACYLPLRTLAFLNHWLRGTPDHSPGFSYYRDWVTYQGHGPTNQYADASAFPIAGTKTFFLSAQAGLVANEPGRSATAVLVNPPGGVPSAFSELSNFTGPDASPNAGQLQPTEIGGQNFPFDSQPFASAVDSVGIPSARLTLSHTTPTDLVLYGKVFDVAPDGTATLIHRLIAPIRIPSAALSRPVDIKLLGFAHRFAKGHRVRLTLCTTDTTSFNNPVADVITISTPGSTFTLPYRKV